MSKSKKQLKKELKIAIIERDALLERLGDAHDEITRLDYGIERIGLAVDKARNDYRAVDWEVFRNFWHKHDKS